MNDLLVFAPIVLFAPSIVFTAGLAALHGVAQWRQRRSWVSTLRDIHALPEVG